MVVRIRQDLREFVALTMPQKRINDTAQEDVYSDGQEEWSAGAPKLMPTVGTTLASTLKANYMTAAGAVKDALQ